MSTVARRRKSRLGENGELPPLEAGDRLDQPMFHARYVAMPEGVRAELIGGTVYMPSPAKPRHGRTHSAIGGWLFNYATSTPGTESFDDTTVILGGMTEVQPDAFLLLSPRAGGNVRENADGYLEGAPELLAEAASSTESYDLHDKKEEYERAGVKEYVVVALRQARVLWFVQRRGAFKQMPPDADGILRSKVFPGLWLDPAALLRFDGQRIDQVLRLGLASPQHAAFVKKLARRMGGKSG